MITLLSIMITLLSIYHQCFIKKPSLYRFPALLSTSASIFSYPPMVYHNEYSCEWPKTHRFPMNKFIHLKEYLVNSSIIESENILHTPLHPLDIHVDSQCEGSVLQAIFNVHEKEYVLRFLRNELTLFEKKRIGLEFNDFIIRRTLAEVAGTCTTVDLAFQYGLAANLAGGTHHAHYDYGSGFCILNDIAVAAKRAVNYHRLTPVMIFDLDVHQGDGTASIFENDSSVYTVSIHCQDNFPFQKSNSNIDIGLKEGTGDEEYLSIMKSTFILAIQTCQPKLVIYDAGVDISIDDRLGRLKVTNDGIFQRDLWVIESCLQHNIPCAAVIGGGYDDDPMKLTQRHALLHQAAIVAWRKHKRL